MEEKQGFKELLRDFWKDFSIILAIVAISSISFIVSYHFKDWLWFSRSGSLAVLFALILEYRHFGFIKNENMGIELGASKLQYEDGCAVSLITHGVRYYFVITAHIFVIIGTLIWGYGDLIGCLFGFFRMIDSFQ